MRDEQKGTRNFSRSFLLLNTDNIYFVLLFAKIQTESI